MKALSMPQMLRHTALATALLLGSAWAAAQDSSSIKMIDADSFGITDQEIAGIRAQMQAAVDGNHIAGALLLVGNDNGIGMLETVGT
ncbi:MAG TPA: hypothetical protein DEG76_09735 [Pseudohongiella sp.]|nr:hypothetical protein [Pseudohongiella sp.]